MIIELIGTWVVIGFFSAIGWGAADKAVVEPYVKPAIAKSMDRDQTPPKSPMETPLKDKQSEGS
jgi:hypothetical protein